MEKTCTQCRMISIHAPARGATYNMGLISWIKEFQSTLPRGERLQTFRLYKAEQRISIHAPARGATEIDCDLIDLFCNFNPRSREGSDVP